MFGWFKKNSEPPLVFPDNRAAFDYAISHMDYPLLLGAVIPALVEEEGKAGAEGERYYLLRLATRGGDRASARRMWQQIFEQAEEGVLRENARERLRVLDSLDAASALTRQVAEYRSRTGRRPARLDDVRRAGLWSGPLADSAGVPFSYDETSGRVTVSRDSSMWRPEGESE